MHLKDVGFKSTNRRHNTDDKSKAIYKMQKEYCGIFRYSKREKSLRLLNVLPGIMKGYAI